MNRGRKSRASPLRPRREAPAALLHEGEHGLGRVAGAEVDGLAPGPRASSACAQRDCARLVEHPLRHGSARSAGPPPGGRPSRPPSASSSSRGTTRLTRPSRSASSAGMMSAQQRELLGPCRPTSRGRIHEPPPSMLQAPPGEDLGEPGVVAGHDQVAAEGEVQPAPDAHARHLGDRRLRQRVQRLRSHRDDRDACTPARWPASPAPCRRRGRRPSRSRRPSPSARRSGPRRRCRASRNARLQLGPHRRGTALRSSGGGSKRDRDDARRRVRPARVSIAGTILSAMGLNPFRQHRALAPTT